MFVQFCHFCLSKLTSTPPPAPSAPPSASCWGGNRRRVFIGLHGNVTVHGSVLVVGGFATFQSVTSGPVHRLSERHKTRISSGQRTSGGVNDSTQVESMKSKLRFSSDTYFLDFLLFLCCVFLRVSEFLDLKASQFELVNI